MKKKMMILSALLMTTACWAGQPLSAIASATSSFEQDDGQESGGALFIDVMGGFPDPISGYCVIIMGQTSGITLSQTGFGPTFSFLNAPDAGFPNGLPADTYSFIVSEQCGGALLEACKLPRLQSVHGTRIIPKTTLNFPFVKVVPDQCMVGEKGSITGIVTGGKPLYKVVLISTTQTPIDTITNLNQGDTFTFSGLNGDQNYTLVATDSLGILSTFMRGCFPLPLSDLDFTVPMFRPDCNELPVNIVVGVTGGVPPFKVAINGRSVIGGPQQTRFPFPLLPDDYIITVTDKDECSRTQEVTVPGVLSFTTVATPVNCEPDQLGSIEVTVSGGFPPYKVTIPGHPDPMMVGPSTFLFPKLVTGDYEVRVEDSNTPIGSTTPTPCIAVPEIVDVPLNTLDCSVVNTTPQSFEQKTGGTITVEVTGGVAPYTITVKSNAFTDEKIITKPAPFEVTFDNLPADRYIVTVTDSAGFDVPCPCTQCVFILSDNNPILNFTNVKYCGDVCP